MIATLKAGGTKMVAGFFKASEVGDNAGILGCVALRQDLLRRG